MNLMKLVKDLYNQNYKTLLRQTKSDTEDDSENHAQSKQRNGKRILKNDNSIGDLWDDIEHSNIPITGIPKEESEREAEKCLKK